MDRIDDVPRASASPTRPITAFVCYVGFLACAAAATLAVAPVAGL